jgi:hypothetical protein
VVLARLKVGSAPPVRLSAGCRIATLAAVGSLVTVLAAGCGSPTDELNQLKDSADPVFYLGMKFEELPLSSAVEFPLRGQRGRFPKIVPRVDVTYGSCRTNSRGSCRLGLHIITLRCGSGKAGVAIWAETRDRATRAAKRIRPLNLAARRSGWPSRISFGSEPGC